MVVMVNANFNTISVISWRSVLLEEETGILGELKLIWLWCLTLISTIFQSYPGDQYYRRRKPEYSEKT